METLKYKIIKTKAQYKEYCAKLEELVFKGSTHKAVADEIDLLTLLIEKWDAEHNSFKTIDPIQLLNSFLVDHNLKAIHLAEILQVSKGYVSDILNYKKGLSKDVIRMLAHYFNVSQEAFNRPYYLKAPLAPRPKKGKQRVRRELA